MFNSSSIVALAGNINIDATKGGQTMTALEKAVDKASELLAKREDENEYHLHDVDRKWVIEAMMDYAEYCLKGTFSQTEISDEEIEKEADNTYVKYNAYAIEGFIDGAKWYREQLKIKQNEINNTKL